MTPVTSAMATMQSTTRLATGFSRTRPVWKASRVILLGTHHRLDGLQCNGFQINIDEDHELNVRNSSVHEDAPKGMWGTGDPAFSNHYMSIKKGEFPNRVSTGGSFHPTWCPADSPLARRLLAPLLAAHCAGRPCAPWHGNTETRNWS